MRTTRLPGTALLAALTFLGACGDDDPEGTGPPASATVRFVNTTGQSLDVGTGGSFTAANTDVAFGEVTGCITVEPPSGSIAFRENGGTSTVSPSGFSVGALQPGGTHTVVIGGTSGAYTAIMFNDVYAGATTTQGRARLINVTGATYDISFAPIAEPRPGTPQSAALPSGSATPWAPLSGGPHYFYLTTTTPTSVTDALVAEFPVAVNDYITIVTTPPMTAGGPPRSFLVAPCRP